MNSYEMIRVSVIDTTTRTAVHDTLVEDVGALAAAIATIRTTYPDKTRYQVSWDCVRVPVEA